MIGLTSFVTSMLLLWPGSGGFGPDAFSDEGKMTLKQAPVFGRAEIESLFEGYLDLLCQTARVVDQF